MPRWVFSGVYPQDLACVFGVFSRTANRIRMIPEALHSQLLAEPDRLQKGSRIAIRLRRYGLAQTIELEVTDFNPETSFTEKQIRGPFRSWTHNYRFEPTGEGATLLTETIDYEPPGGLLGLQVTAATIERDLRELYELREPLLRQLLDEADQ
jgi:ligand-binding SRPBCC domain-containing protein